MENITSIAPTVSIGIKFNKESVGTKIWGAYIEYLNNKYKDNMGGISTENTYYGITHNGVYNATRQDNFSNTFESIESFVTHLKNTKSEKYKEFMFLTEIKEVDQIKLPSIGVKYTENTNKKLWNEYLDIINELDHVFEHNSSYIDRYYGVNIYGKPTSSEKYSEFELSCSDIDMFVEYLKQHKNEKNKSVINHYKAFMSLTEVGLLSSFTPPPDKVKCIKSNSPAFLEGQEYKVDQKTGFIYYSSGNISSYHWEADNVHLADFKPVSDTYKYPKQVICINPGNVNRFVIGKRYDVDERGYIDIPGPRAYPIKSYRGEYEFEDYHEAKLNGFQNQLDMVRMLFPMNQKGNVAGTNDLCERVGSLTVSGVGKGENHYCIHSFAGILWSTEHGFSKPIIETGVVSWNQEVNKTIDLSNHNITLVPNKPVSLKISKQKKFITSKIVESPTIKEKMK